MGRKSLASKRKAQILDALYRCISKHGLQNTTIKMVAKEAGVQPSIVYHYFKDRDEIIEELFGKVADDLMDSYEDEMSGVENPEERFKKGLEYLFVPEFNYGDKGSLPAFYYSCAVEAKRNPSVRRGIIGLIRRYRSAILQVLKETGIAEGLSSDEAKDLASMLMAIEDGVGFQRHMDGRNISLENMLRMTEKFIRLYVEDKRKG